MENRLTIKEREPSRWQGVVAHDAYKLSRPMEQTCGIAGEGGAEP
jgi:hypothetical protein